MFDFKTLEDGGNLYGKGMCGLKGDNTTEKPWFGDVVGVQIWNYWTKYNGTPQTLC